MRERVSERVSVCGCVNVWLCKCVVKCRCVFVNVRLCLCVTLLDALTAFCSSSVPR